jgi:ketosteroid isomerase-like protein
LRFFEKTVAEAGDATNVRVAHHFTVRGGLIARFEQFVDTAMVRDAAAA